MTRITAASKLGALVPPKPRSRFLKKPKRVLQILDPKDLKSWGVKKPVKVHVLKETFVRNPIKLVKATSVAAALEASRKVVTPTSNKPISRRSKELEYNVFLDNTAYAEVNPTPAYNTIFDATHSVSEDLPVFALDLYNLYLHNLETQQPVKLQQWVTRANRSKTNKRYKKLLLEYTTLLKTFYTQVSATKLKKKTAAHNAVLLINQFSRVAGARTTNYLQKRWRFLSVKTMRFFLRHKHFQKFWRTKKSLFKMKVIMSRMLMWLYNTTNSKHLLGVKLRKAFLQNYETDKRFIYKKKMKLHLKSFKALPQINM